MCGLKSLNNVKCDR